MCIVQNYGFLFHTKNFCSRELSFLGTGASRDFHYWEHSPHISSFCLFRALCTIIYLYFIVLYFVSERELTFTFATFAICCRPSVCRLSVVCLSVVGNARAPYSGGSNFPQYFYGIWYPSHPLTSTENFTEIVPGEPLRRGS